MELVMEQLGIHIIILMICVYYGIRMMITRDASMLFGKDKKAFKNESEYAKYAGMLVILLGVASLIMGVVAMFDKTAALVLIVVSVVGLGVLWKIINQKYGA